MPSYVEPGYVEPDYVETEEALGVGFPLNHPLAVTAATTSAVPTPIPWLPYGLYGIIPAVVLTTFRGHRLFSPVAMEARWTVPPFLERSVTLQSVSTARISQGASSTPGVGQAASAERTQWSAAFDNRKGAWGRIIANEILLGATGQYGLDYGQGRTVIIVIGSVEEIELRRSSCHLSFGG